MQILYAATRGQLGLKLCCGIVGGVVIGGVGGGEVGRAVDLESHKLTLKTAPCVNASIRSHCIHSRIDMNFMHRLPLVEQ